MYVPILSQTISFSLPYKQIDDLMNLMLINVTDTLMNTIDGISNVVEDGTKRDDILAVNHTGTIAEEDDS
jgi:hypothetical protein